MAYTYASEADILNMALFGKTASQWRSEKGIKGKNSNIRDFASAEELIGCAYQSGGYKRWSDKTGSA